MSSINFKAAHDENGAAGICPFMSGNGGIHRCIEERCELWTTDRDDSYSACAVNRIYSQLMAIYFGISGGISG